MTAMLLHALMWYKFTISHHTVKELTVAHSLSRASTSLANSANMKFYQDAEIYVNLIMGSLAVTEQRLAEIKQQQDDDETFRQLKSSCESG